MQTFLPYADFFQSVRSLDNKRLGKQRVEAYQILNTLQGRSKGWRNHPAVKMWSSFEEALKLYMNFCIIEWKSRGFKNTMQLADIDTSKLNYPNWFGNNIFHESHRSNLLRKDETYYRKFGWNEPTNLPYVWPKV